MHTAPLLALFSTYLCSPAAAYIWLVLGMTLDPLVPLLAPLLGLPLQPGMDRPFVSRSLREFWGRR